MVGIEGKVVMVSGAAGVEVIAVLLFIKLTEDGIERLPGVVFIPVDVLLTILPRRDEEDRGVIARDVFILRVVVAEAGVGVTLPLLSDFNVAARFSTTSPVRCKLVPRLGGVAENGEPKASCCLGGAAVEVGLIVEVVGSKK